MRRILLLAGACGVAGGMGGTALVLWLRPPEVEGSGPAPSSAAPAARAPRAAAAGDAEVLRRLDAVERTLSALRAGGTALRTAAAAESAAHEPAAAPVGDPVFEAAVLDVLERAEDERDSERSERRKERARQQAEHWARELTERLELSPEQAAQLGEIRARLQTELRDLSSTGEGRFVPRAERRAARVALRERAEQQLKAALQPRQLASYEQLDSELKLVRSPEPD